MPVIIRFARAGTNNKPFFHVVAADKTAKRDGRHLERLGTYYPKAKEDKEKFLVDMEKLLTWVKKGAQVSETVGHFLKVASKSK